MDNIVRVCPECKKEFTGYGSISRKDDKTIICPECGVIQAIEAYVEYFGSFSKNKEEEYF